MNESDGDLRADCGACAGLCCVALPFAASADFAEDKPAGRPCRHLTADHRCGIHDRLRDSGYQGCAVFDCYGAGQRVTARPGLVPGAAMFEVFRVTRQLHELLWYLAEAAERAEPAEPSALYAEIDALVAGDAGTLVATDVDALRARVGPVLERAAARVHAGAGAGDGRDLRGADLVGARMRGARLRGARLRGALLIAADLRGADLRTADLLGADLRDTDLRGADLSGCLFLTQPQLEAARGDTATVLPSRLSRPAHWPAAHPGGAHGGAGHMAGPSAGKATPRGRAKGHRPGKRSGDGSGGRRGRERYEGRRKGTGGGPGAGRGGENRNRGTDRRPDDRG